MKLNIPKHLVEHEVMGVDTPSGMEYFDTGWINRSDWTNVHLGSDTTKDVDSNVTHNLDANLEDLIVRVLISSDGTDANAIEIYGTAATVGPDSLGCYTVYYVDADNIKVQTSDDGVFYLDDSGVAVTVDTEDWYYKVKVWKLK